MSLNKSYWRITLPSYRGYKVKRQVRGQGQAGKVSLQAGTQRGQAQAQALPAVGFEACMLPATKGALSRADALELTGTTQGSLLTPGPFTEQARPGL